LGETCVGQCGGDREWDEFFHFEQILSLLIAVVAGLAEGGLFEKVTILERL